MTNSAAEEGAEVDAGSSLHAAKRLKTAPYTADCSPLSPDVLAEDRVSGYRDAFATAEPFPYAVIDGLCDPALLREVRDEIIGNLDVTFKETDIYKLFQTGDLANMARLDEASLARLPRLDALRRAIYGPAFRSLVRTVTRCGELTDRTDLSCNCYARGCHLLCHDDVIGTRAVSFIIYLTDPDDAFGPEDGGALELYPLEKPGVPAAYPSASVTPIWNRMAFFAVLPGRSFHAVQEVFSDKPRLSISGWFHGPAPPEGAEQATLAQLHSRSAAEGDGAFTALARLAPTPDGPAGLSPSDLQHLSRFVDAEYLTAEVLGRARVSFRANDDSMQMAGFLRADVARAILAAARKADRRDGLGDGEVPTYDAGHTARWRPVGPPHKHRYLRFEAPEGGVSAAGDGPADEAGRLLWDLREGLFSHPAFARLLGFVASAEVSSCRGEVRRFRPGLDYTIAHFGQLGHRGHRLDCTLCFVDDTGPIKSEAWESDNFGGFESYMEAEDDNGAQAAEVYRRPGGAKGGKGSEGAEGSSAGAGGDGGAEKGEDEDDAPLLSVSAASNALNMVLRGPGVLRFVKYLSAYAPGSRWDVSFEYEAAALDGSDDEDGSEDGAE